MRLIDADVLKEMVPTTSVDMFENCSNCSLLSEEQVLELIDMTPTVDMWIPIKWHTITDEEREENGYPKDWVYHLDCEMPEDEQEILVTTKNGYVEKDVCYLDDGYSLDSGWDWREDVVAWMPLPEPYREDGEA